MVLTLIVIVIYATVVIIRLIADRKQTDARSSNSHTRCTRNIPLIPTHIDPSKSNIKQLQKACTLTHSFNALTTPVASGISQLDPVPYMVDASTLLTYTLKELSSTFDGKRWYTK